MQIKKRRKLAPSSLQGSHKRQNGVVVATGHHSHESSQTIFVLEGVLTIEEEDAVHRVEAGSVINIPPGVPHRHSNYEDRPLRQLVIWNPPSEEVRGLR